MGDLDLEAIRARLEAATPGPWRLRRWPRCTDIVSSKRHVAQSTDIEGPDANLIAHAPTDIAALLAEVERRRTDAKTAASMVEGLLAERTRLRTESAGLRAAVETFREALENPDTYEELGWGGHVLADAELAQAAAEERAKGGTS